jgi:hypothetical protein
VSGFKPSIGGFGVGKSVSAAKVGLRPLGPLALKAADPLKDSESTGNLEADTEKELSAIEKGFRERSAQEKERFEAATETSFYCCLVFDSGDQCGAFLKATGLDKGASDLFVDGRVLARMMGIPLPDPVIKFDREFKIDKKLKAMALPLKGEGNDS